MNLDKLFQILYSNRSACYSKIKNFSKALEDATACITLDSKWSKAYGRQADAYIGLELWNDAKTALEMALDLNSSSILELKDRLHYVEKQLNK